MRRIALLTNYPADFASFTGGVETATAGLLEGLAMCSARFECHVVSAPAGLAKSQLTVQGDFHYHFLAIPHRFQRPRLPFRAWYALRAIRSIDPDLVHCQDNVALALAAIWSGCPRLYTIHGIKRREAGKRAGRERAGATLEGAVEPFVYRHFDNFICISQYAQEMVGASKRVYRVPNALRPALFDVRRTAASNAPLLLFVGALSPLKGVHHLLAVHKRLRRHYSNLRTVLCGEPESRSYAAHLAALAGAGVEFFGRAPLPALLELLAQATALVLPSNQENAPMVVAEAMAAGVPVVATRVGALPEMVEDGVSGWLVDPSEDALHAALCAILDDPGAAAEMGRRGRQLAWQRYHPQCVAQATLDVYEQLLR